jgi:hypothetical protein
MGGFSRKIPIDYDAAHSQRCEIQRNRETLPWGRYIVDVLSNCFHQLRIMIYFCNLSKLFGKMMEDKEGQKGAQ